MLGRHNPFADMLTLLGIKGERVRIVKDSTGTRSGQSRLDLIEPQSTPKLALLNTEAAQTPSSNEDSEEVVVETLGEEDYSPTEYE